MHVRYEDDSSGAPFAFGFKLDSLSLRSVCYVQSISPCLCICLTESCARISVWQAHMLARTHACTRAHTLSQGRMGTRKQVGATAQLAPVAQKQLTLEGFSLYWLHGATKESVPSPSRRGWLGGRVSGGGDAVREPTLTAFDVISPLRVEAKLALNRMGVASQGAARIEAEVAVVGRAHVNVDCATMRDLSTLVCICVVCVRVHVLVCV